MTTTLKLLAPAGVSGQINGASSATYTIAADRSVTVSAYDVAGLLNQGYVLFGTNVAKCGIKAPVAADLVSIVAAVTPSNGALTLAAQPPHARKLQIRIVVGTTTTTAITAGNLALVGTTIDGDAVSENISLVQNASATVKSQYAYASITSATVSGYAANGSGTGNTVGIGLSNDFAVPTMPGIPYISTDFTILKSTKITDVLGTSVTAADDAATSGTVDASARTFAPTTAPSSTGLVSYEFTYSFAGGVA